MQTLKTLGLMIVALLPAYGGNPSAELKLKVVQGRPLAEQVFLNGRGPYKFLLDTGAQSNQIDIRLAGTLGLTAAFRVELATAAGSRMVSGGRLQQVTLGSAEAQDQEFLFTTLEGVREISPGIHGVLGQEFLARFDYLLDFRGHRIVFGASASSEPRTAVRIIDGRMAVPTNHGELILDSGTDALILFRGSPAGSAARIQTATGFAQGGAPRESRVLIGNREYRPAVSAVVPQPSPEAGLLAASIFRSVYISNSGRYIIPEPTR